MVKLLDIGNLSYLELAVGIIGIIITVVAIRLYYVWFTRIRPRVPSTDSDWNTDCEFQSKAIIEGDYITCLLYTSPSPRDNRVSRMPSSA